MKTEGQLLPEQGHIARVRVGHAAGAREPRGVHARPRRHPQMGGEASGRPGDRRGHRRAAPPPSTSRTAAPECASIFRASAATVPSNGRNGSGTSTRHECAFVYDNDTTVPGRAAATASSRRRSGRILLTERLARRRRRWAPRPDQLYSDLLRRLRRGWLWRRSSMRLHISGLLAAAVLVLAAVPHAPRPTHSSAPGTSRPRRPLRGSTGSR